MNTNQIIKSFCFLLLLTPLCLLAKDVNVKDFGAVGDGKTLNSEVLQKAIDECNRTGGGKVIFPEGIFLSGTLCLAISALPLPSKSISIFSNVRLVM